jgi:hypothetical protein
MEWVRASYGTGDTGSVEVAFEDNQVYVRNSRFSSVLSFTVEEWAAFTACVSDGEFDVPDEHEEEPAPKPAAPSLEMTLTDAYTRIATPESLSHLFTANEISYSIDPAQLSWLKESLK